MTEETKQKLRAAGREDLIAIAEINLSGYAGILSNGNIVDRRFYPNAIPVPENKLFNIPEPKPIIVLSLRQPWASLIFHRIDEHFFAKMWETRGWKTKYRGCLHIHSSQKFHPEDVLLTESFPFCKYLIPPLKLPLGQILGFVDLTKIMHTEDWIHDIGHTPEVNPYEDDFGDYSDGRFAWKLENPQLCKSEIKCNGALSIWEYDYETNGPKKKKK
jgi:hypothetical protein